MTQDINVPVNGPAQKMIHELTGEQIARIADALTRTRPAYGPLMDFYGRVFSAQAAAGGNIRLDPIMIEDDLLALKKENEMPLISPGQFKIDFCNAVDLMKEICLLADSHAPKLAVAAESLKTYLGQNNTADALPQIDRLFSALLDSRDISSLASEIGIPVEALGFFGFTAMAPSVRACAEQLATYLNEDKTDDNETQGNGYCPVCGSLPDFAMLDDSGKKHVSCSLCSHVWPVKRMGCLFCGSTSTQAQQYFYSGEEPEYRVYCCDDCQKYIKTVDTRQLGRRFFPKLEQIASLHLDYKAGEKGYHPGQGSGTFNI